MKILNEDELAAVQGGLLEGIGWALVGYLGQQIIEGVIDSGALDSDAESSGGQMNQDARSNMYN